MSASLRKMLMSLAVALFLYIALSGPLAGLVCYAERMDPVHHEFWAGVYEKHRAIYFPLFDLAGRLGWQHRLMSYWTFWGWQYQE